MHVGVGEIEHAKHPRKKLAIDEPVNRSPRSEWPLEQLDRFSSGAHVQFTGDRQERIAHRFAFEPVGNAPGEQLIGGVGGRFVFERWARLERGAPPSEARGPLECWSLPRAAAGPWPVVDGQLP